MKKIILLAILSCIGLTDAASLNDVKKYHLEYVATPDSGYTTYMSGDIMFIDASDDLGRIASISIPTVWEDGQAGYAIVPAKNFDEYNQNGQFARAYTVDCARQVIFDEDDHATKISEMNALHANASFVACAALDAKK